MKKLTLAMLALGLGLGAQIPCSNAQDAPAPKAPAPASTPAAPGGPGGPGGDRMQQFRQRINERIKSELKASDDEWSVIQPLLEKVQDAGRKTMAGRFGGFRGMRGGPGGQDNRRGGDNNNNANRPNSFSNPEADALKSTLDAEGSTPADIKAKLEALRASRKKATAELEQAQEDLRKVLTQRQEATLVWMGVLQ